MVPTSSESPLGSAGVDDPAPASGQEGFRAFRYALPETPVAAASVDIGHIGVRFELFLLGDLDIAVSTRRGPTDHRPVRACALKVLRTMAKGLIVGAVGSSAPTLNSAAGHVFSQVGYRFRAPNTMSFTGGCGIDFAQRCDGGTVALAGDLKYTLDVTAMPTDGRPLDLTGPVQSGAWFQRHEEELASIGVVVLVAVPLAPGQLVAADAS
jgi:hypothetical protein